MIKSASKSPVLLLLMFYALPLGAAPFASQLATFGGCLAAIGLQACGWTVSPADLETRSAGSQEVSRSQVAQLLSSKATSSRGYEYGPARLKSEVSKPNQGLVDIVDDSGKQRLRIAMKEGSHGCESNGGGICPKFEGLDLGQHAVMHFSLFLPKDFSPAKMGKFAGFGTGDGFPSGGKDPKPGQSSIRGSWRKHKGQWIIVGYLYAETKYADFGDYLYPLYKKAQAGMDRLGVVILPGNDRVLQNPLKLGQVNDITYVMKMNTFRNGKPVADGSFRIEVNGALHLQTDQIIFSEVPGGSISSIEASFFSGGGSSYPVPSDTSVELVGPLRVFKY